MLVNVYRLLHAKLLFVAQHDNRLPVTAIVMT